MTEVLAGAPTGVIDTHAHVWDPQAPWMAWLADRPASWDVVRRRFTFSDLRDELDRCAVAEVLLVQAACSLSETRQLLELARGQTRVAGVVGWVTLTSPDETAAQLDSLADLAGLVGVRGLYGWVPDGEILADPRVRESCAVVAERGLVLDLFLDHHELALAVPIADGVPGGRYVINHLGRPALGDEKATRAWAESMSALAERPNVFVKFSGWATVVQRAVAAEIRPYLEHVVDVFGADRIMYAGNWPVALVAADYEATFAATLGACADLSPRQRAAIFRDTAVRCYRLGAGPHDTRAA